MSIYVFICDYVYMCICAYVHMCMGMYTYNSLSSNELYI